MRKQDESRWRTVDDGPGDHRNIYGIGEWRDMLYDGIEFDIVAATKKETILKG